MKLTKNISGINYRMSTQVESDCSVTITIKSQYSDLPVFYKKYGKSIEKAVFQGWRDYDKIRAQLMANKL